MNLLIAVLLAVVPGTVLLAILTDFSAAGVASGTATQNAALYPGVVACVMGLLVVADVIGTVRREGFTVPALSIAAATARNAIRPAIVFAIFLTYIYLFPRIGFAISTLMVVTAVHITLAPLQMVAAVLNSVISTSAIWLIFAQILRLSLPHGTWLG